VIVVTYYKINQYMASLGELGRIDPFFALWIPFVFFAALTIWMYYTIAYVPGGQPIGALERMFAKLSKLIARYLPRRRLRDAHDADTVAT
jgi:lipopolysaccharide export system permease protein